MPAERPHDHAAEWAVRAPAQLAVLLFVLLAGVALFPLALVLAPLGFAAVLAGLLFGAVRWPRLFDTLFGVGLPLRGWVVASAFVASALVGTLVFVERYTVEAAGFALVVAVCLPWVVVLVVDGRLRAAATRPMRLSVWPIVVFTLLAVTGGLVFGWRTPEPFDFAIFGGFIVVACLVLVVFPMTIAQAHSRRESDEDTLADTPFVSVLIPAYNESSYIGNCIQSVLASDYPTDRLEVIVVDDGSTDDTYTEAASHRNERVSVFTRANGGKHAALNFGLSCARGEVLVGVDADSTLHPTALQRAVARLQSDSRIGAVAGTVVIDNPQGIVGGVQALEYVLGINTLRRAFSYLGTVMVVPGCLGVFRREALEGVGGYDADTVTEDFDLTVRLIKAGWRVELTESIVYTEAPFSLGDLLNQRLRWTRGNIQTLLKHRDVFTSPQYGFLHRFAFPLSALSLLFVPFASLLVTVTLVSAIFSGSLFDVVLAAGYFLLVLAVVSAMALDLSNHDFRLLAYVPFHIFGYRQFLDFVILRTMASLLQGTGMRWESVTRARQQESSASTTSQPQAVVDD
ncbi:glycosyltransferase [Halogranum rubrum]|uniref:Glycosyl transferase n=1 Tax=Halogranum salarium B-1 TaxID=1210908 RepID=J3JGD3_9EURY|nr:glycosyltransferase family 2 protein [Halogranum salarium]EJN60001.1 glycosyl transferase [Halogranum salarium B-1]